MRLVDKIASDILDSLESNSRISLFEIKDENYLDIECMIADLIAKGINNHLCSYDLDLCEGL